MCGIVGIVQCHSGIDDKLLRRMTDTLRHRGPDDEGFYFNQSQTVGFGFRRLSIIDLETGHQPLSNEDRTIWAMLNGEIYNFMQLRNDLLHKGHNFSTKTDTECIVHGYEEYKEGIFSKLNGMFSIAIWDSKSNKLLLARDRAGEKPLFYFFNGHTFIFASEIKAILLHPEVSREINWQAVNEFFSFGYIGAPLTVYECIKKLEPGKYLILERSALRIEDYWSINYGQTFEGDYSDAKLKILSLLEDAVRIRMVSDVPLGAFLSGGVDSSSVVALMARNSHLPVKTFSIGFSEKDFDETSYAKIVARRYGTDHTELVLTPYLDASTIESIILNFDEPFGDSSALPTYCLSKLTRQYVTVSLSGDGGDELFGGYSAYRCMLRRKIMLDRIPGILKSFSRLVSRNLHYDNKVWRGIDFVGAENDAFRFIMMLTNFSKEEIRNLVGDDLRNLIEPNEHSLRRKLQYFGNEDQFATEMLFSDFKHYLPDDILIKVDRMSMMNSLESRAPYLDHRLIEFAFSLPSDWKVTDTGTKMILKDALKEILPREIIGRDKMGFGVPLKHWFTKELLDLCQESLLNRQAGRLLKEAAVRRYLKDHVHGRKDHSQRIWFMLCLVLWAKKNNIIC